MLTPAILKSYILDMSAGHTFDLPDHLFAQIFPPGRGDPAARDKLQALADECDCTLVDNRNAFELVRR